MEIFYGKSIYKGIAIGKVFFLDKNQQRIKRARVSDVEAEIQRYNQAKTQAKNQLLDLHEKAINQVGGASAMIFDIHAMLVEDEDYADSVYNIIRTEKVNAEYAVAITGDNFYAMFSAMEDDYFRARATDIKDISERLVRILQGKEIDMTQLDEPVIVVAEDLVPSETVALDKSKLLSFVTKKGSSNSHTAILARNMNLPSLIGVEVDKKWNGKLAIVDGKSGKIIIEPDEETVQKYHKIKKQEMDGRALWKTLKGKPNETKDGKRIQLYANINNVGDVGAVLANDASGIGLMRSEFLYMEGTTYPSEEEQFSVYKTVAQNMAGKKVIIRTLDIGADKQAEYFQLEEEENPAMGYRAIRICLDRVQMFKAQLRAIYRASAFGNISIMFPMIISLEEVMKIKAICEEVKKELTDDGLQYGQVEMGIMIETPAAVMISDLLAKEVDFFSIGTNDLTQYTLAIDRQNPNLEEYYNPHHEAVLRMIQMVIDNGHKENCWVGICGELASDTSLTEMFIQMGIDELSVAAPLVFPVRKAIREAVYQKENQ